MKLEEIPRASQRVGRLEQEVSGYYIQETLSIYKPEHIYLESATWNGPKLSGRFRLEPYPFTKEGHIEYMPASMLMLYLSQLGYVYARSLCEADLLPAPIRITTEDFFRARDEGNIVFIGFDKIRFREKAPLHASSLEIKMRIEPLFKERES